MLVFDRTKIKAGMVVHIRSYGWFGKTIRKVLSCRGKYPVWGNHDAIFVQEDGVWWIGESEPPCAKLTPLKEYESLAEAGEIEVKVYDIKGATETQRQNAVQYWLSRVHGTLYDFLAFPRLFLKAWFIDVFQTDVGWEWAHWCTEGVAYAWDRGAKKPVWKKNNPTPWTTEKKVGDTLVDVTNEVMKEDR
jgi:hypothetical protein